MSDRPLLAATIIIAISAFLTLSSTPHILFNLITVPLLIQFSTATDAAHFLKVSIPVLTAASTLRAVPTIFGLLLSSPGLAVLIQTAFSLCLAVFIAVPIAADATLCKKLRLSGVAAAGDFGLVWAATWWAWEGLSPFGRYGIPSALPLLAPVAYTVRLAGPTGHDILLGYISYACFQIGSGAFDRLGPFLPKTSGDTTPLITLEEDEEDVERGAVVAVAGDDEPLTPSSRRVSLVHLLGTLRPPTTRTKVAAAVVLAAVTVPWLPAPLSLSAPLSQVTPVTIGCVLGPTHQHLPDALIHESLRLGGHDAVLVWPESALEVDSAASRSQALAEVTERMGQTHGTLVAVGMESRTENGKLKNEMGMVGPSGVVGEYSKQHLFPVIESYLFDRERQFPPVWKLPLRRPATVPKSNWAARNISLTPLICLDTFHTSLLQASDSRSTPSLLIIPAAFPTFDLGVAAIDQIRMLAVSHATPAFVCSATKTDPSAGFAAYIDSWGRVTHLQRGGPSLSITIPLRHYDNARGQRSRTLWEILGPIGVWDAALLLLFPAQAGKVLKALLKIKGVPVPEGVLAVGERTRRLMGYRVTEEEVREGGRVETLI